MNAKAKKSRTAPDSAVQEGRHKDVPFYETKHIYQSVK